MPESKGRPKPSYTPPPGRSKPAGPSPRWWAPTFVTLLLLGLVWIVTFYVSEQRFPVQALGYWNLGVGFGLMMTGFSMTMNWR
ncbi:MAG TPA: cell division protein CrgA [Candidatus Lustribacter sp.]|nr:cell division protein CrgA [Candidatus Lustribacter sp.]